MRVFSRPAAFVLALLASSSALAQPLVPSGGAALPAKDVLVVAMGAKDPSEDSRLGHLARRFLGVDSAEDSLFDMQIRLVASSAIFGPVLLLSADDAMKADIWRNCSIYEICEQLKNGSVRVTTVPHTGPWIRDYGPYVTVEGAAVRAARGRYFKSHVTESFERRRTAINKERLRLIEEVLDQDSSILALLQSKDDREKRRTDVLNRLSLLTHYAEVLKDPATQAILRRDADDQSAFGLMASLLTRPEFKLEQSELDIDGGNLLRLTNGRCLTTRALFGENPGHETEVDSQLRALFGCSDVTYLDPLPGPGVIPHVDMFVLPVSGNRLLLGTYDLANLQGTSDWNTASRRIQSLVLDAAEEMNRNERRLRQSGYDVTLVPLLLPIEAHGELSDDEIYYPTNLNATVRSNGVDRLQVLLPVYDGVQRAAQKTALDIIKSAFRTSAEFVEIESTAAAQGQGAVHCLTLTVPEAPTIFGDVVESQQHAMAAAVRRIIERENTSKAIPDALNLTGRWLIYDDKIDAVPDPEDATASAVLDATTVRLMVKSDRNETREITGRYTLEKIGRGDWNMTITLPAVDRVPARTIRARLEWESDDKIRLTVGGDPVALRRVELTIKERTAKYHSELKLALEAGDIEKVRTAIRGARTELSEQSATTISNAIDEMLSVDLLRKWPVEVFKALDSTADLQSIAFTPETWNEICWTGSLQGVDDAKIVAPACESAVKLDPDPNYYDSRAVNRALRGDFPGAIADFQIFIQAAKDANASQLAAQRAAYVEILSQGKNPITPEELQRLRTASK